MQKIEVSNRKIAAMIPLMELIIREKRDLSATDMFKVIAMVEELNKKIELIKKVQETVPAEQFNAVLDEKVTIECNKLPVHILNGIKTVTTTGENGEPIEVPFNYEYAFFVKDFFEM